MSLVAQLALVSDTPALGANDLTLVAAALQKQITRDVAPAWDVQATIGAFVRLEDVPPGYWSIVVRDDIEVDAAGVHCDHSGQPFALVSLDTGWSVTASHEALEMLVDPFGNRTISGDSIKRGQGRVDYLVEIADPTGDSRYSVNGVAVSDFYTPRYFDPAKASGVQYSFTGAIDGPRQVLENGYLTWHDPVGNQWWQQSRFAPGPPRIDSLGPILKNPCGMRHAVDQHAEKRRRAAGRRRKRPAELVSRAVAESARARATALRARIDEVSELSRKSRS
jgi:hypothetical protein